MYKHTRLLRHTYEGACMDFMQRMTAIYNTQKKKRARVKLVNNVLDVYIYFLI